MTKLPVSGAEVALRRPDGVDEMLLHEMLASGAFRDDTAGGAIEAGLMLLGRLGVGALDCADLAVTDFEFLLLTARAARFGQRMDLVFRCPHCRDLAEVTFRVADYLADVRPRVVAGVTPDLARAGWFSFDGAGFRLPTAGDQAAVVGVARPALRLAELCLDDTARRKPHRARVERAMAAMAPELSRPIAGRCPSCGAAVQVALSVARLVTIEIGRAASDMHDEVDLIARAYHWPESSILTLPQERRRAYAERIRRASTQAVRYGPAFLSRTHRRAAGARRSGAVRGAPARG